MVDRRWLIGGTVVAGGGIAYWVYRHNKNAKAAAAGAAGGYGYGMAGYGYGAAGAYGYAYGYGFGASGLGEYGYGGSFGGGSGAYGAGTPVGTPVPQTASNNAQWSEAAVSALTTQGYDGTAVLAALGQYLVGGTLTSDQQGIVSAAIAAEGYPPVSGPNGYPPAMNSNAQSGQTSDGATPATPGGGTHPAQVGAVSNLTEVKSSKTSYTVRWNPVNGATGYHWHSVQLNGQGVKDGQTKATTMTVSGLHSGWTYNFSVQALPGGPGNNIHVTTK